MDVELRLNIMIFFEKVHSLFTHIHNFPFIGMDF